jgi:hypothetical protein
MVPMKHSDAGPFEVVPLDVERAARAVSGALKHAGVRHAFIGGIAVAAHGWRRATSGVDLICSRSDGYRVADVLGGKASGAGIRAMYQGTPVFVYVPRPVEPFLERSVQRPVRVEQLPILSVGALAYLLLARGHAKDEANLAELLKAGCDVRAMSRYMRRNAPQLLVLLRRVAAVAAVESQAE